MKRPRSLSLMVSVCALLALAAVLATRRPRPRASQPPSSVALLCTRVTDGDTLTLDGLGKVRLIGVDCPESSQPGGKQASEFTRARVLKKRVWVEVCSLRPTDRYGRKRAVVTFLDARNQRKNLAIELLRQGYANEYTLPPCHLDTGEWLRFAREARAERRGLWSQLGEVPSAHRGATRLSSVPVDASNAVGVSASGKRFHRRGCRHLPQTPRWLTREEALANGYTACKVCGG